MLATMPLTFAIGNRLRKMSGTRQTICYFQHRGLPMVAARKTRTENRRRGPRGRTGARGPRGPVGPPANGNLSRLAAQMENVIKQLQEQVFRIAQLQTQLDRMAATESGAPTGRQRVATNERA